MVLSRYETTNLTPYENPNHMPGYAGYCPQVKFRHYGNTFGYATAKCFQDMRTTKLNTSVMDDKGISADGQHRFPSLYSNSPDLVLSARARTRERWLNAKKYSLFNEHERGREVKEFDKLAQSHRDHYMDRTGTVPREERFVVPRKPSAKKGPQSTYASDFLSKDARLKCPLSGNVIVADGKDKFDHGVSLKICPASSCTWRDRALRDVYFEKR
ncbi:ciliary microtubule inner protein 2C-like [Montipora capricornis]|uniref:ciliary microtubule inner protein 2C-like n=1 Tax=Montipora capricornis TaxID=246305 RepID=UPI0035F1E5D8